MSFFDLFRWCGFAPNPKPDAPPAASAPSIYLNADGSPRCDYLTNLDAPPTAPPDPDDEGDWTFEDDPQAPLIPFDPDLAEDYDHEWNDK